MRGRTFPFLAGFALALHAVAACSSEDGKAPLASNACTTPPCSTPNLVSGGVATADASALGCFIEPMSGLVLCANVPGCNFALDRALFPDCGFIPSSTGLDLECVCRVASTAGSQTSTSSGALVCPIVVTPTCEAVPNAVLHVGSEQVVCNGPSTATTVASRCRQPSSILQSGAGGSVNCSQTCLQQCAGSVDPQCVTGCCTQ